MTIPDFYPKADHAAQWFADTYPGTAMGTCEKLLLHTTEGSGWPSYDGGAKAPQLTYHPKSHVWHQHFPLSRSARALQDPESTPVRENRDGVIQVEIICSSDPVFAEDHGLLYVADLDDQAIEDLGELAAWLHVNAGLVLAQAPVWLPYPASGRSDSKARMSSAQFDAFKGVCGHMHASGNTHGDPGAIPINQIMAVARDAVDEEIPVSVGTEILAELQKLTTLVTKGLAADQAFYKAEAARYSDLANRTQNLTEAERDRYKYYAGQFTALGEKLEGIDDQVGGPDDEPAGVQA